MAMLRTVGGNGGASMPDLWAGRSGDAVLEGMGTVDSTNRAQADEHKERSPRGIRTMNGCMEG